MNKPIVTFRIDEKGRLNPEIIKMLDEISFRVNSFDELVDILPNALENKNVHDGQRKKYNKIMFSQLDGKAGERAASLIKIFIKNVGISF